MICIDFYDICIDFGILLIYLYVRRGIDPNK